MIFNGHRDKTRLMELEPKHISELITKHLIGKLSDEEKNLLDKWLEDPYNQMQFDKITHGESFLNKFEKYEKYNTQKAWKNLLRSKRKPYKEWLAYAAVILIPLCIGVLIFQNSLLENEQVQLLSENKEATLDEILLTTNKGDYVLGKADTIYQIGSVDVASDSEQLSYNSKKTDNKPQELVYNTLQTPKGVKYKVVLSDGTEVWLNSETKFRYPVNFISNKREVFVEEGEAFFDVTRNVEKPFIVNFNHKKIQVLGTEFNVKSYEDEDNDLVTLVEGSIKLLTENNDVELVPNQQAVIRRINDKMQIKSVEGALYTAWKDNVYLYKNQPLNTIVRDLERDFDIRIFYQNQDLKDEKFSLKISRKLPFEAIFSAIEKTHEVAIEIKDNNVVIRKK